ncbi:hypothetical protein BP5796_11966 [Coleophoma crateriformis]|uniref:Rhodopsin domain-containing protein n=1 Tax=Coleophoma crateriformis TaxID=565419 RepID=A0A3D8QB20_9HELO|nr:hypothetical protein BP5796_11966 [Coleophoma crateriformis]
MVADLSGPTVMGLEWALFTLAVIMVAIRLFVRIRIQRRKLLLSDAFLVISVIDAMALIICDTQSYRLGAMGGSAFTSADSGAAELQQIVTLSKYSFASNYFYDSGIYFPKFTILTFYLKLFPVTKPRLRKALYAVSAFTVSAFVCTAFLDTFWCGSDVASNWSTDAHACSTFNSLVVFQIDWSTNITSDVMIFLLPFPLLRELKLKPRQIIGLAVTFALGAITMAISIARFISVQASSLYNTLYVWSMAEMAVAIIVVSLPALSSLLNRRGQASTTQSYKLNSHYASASGLGSRAAHQKLGSITSGTFSASRSMGHLADENGSDVELNPAKGDPNGIYKRQEVTVESQVLESKEHRASAAYWESH